MTCKICANMNDLFACTKCAYTVCKPCVEAAYAPIACMMCSSKPTVTTRSKSDTRLTTFYPIFKEAIQAFTAASSNDKVKTFQRVMDVVWKFRFTILRHQYLRSVITRKMRICATNANKADWIDRYPWIQGRARELYAFFKWKGISVTIGTHYRRVPSTVATQ